MTRLLIRMTWSLLLTLSFATALGLSAPPTTADDSPADKNSTKLHGRLPAYYGQVVTEEQRMKIYRIQADYQAKLDTLQNQWKTLKQERDEKVAAVLSEEQKKLVEKAAAESKARRSAKARKKPLPPVENAAPPLK